MVHVSTGSSSGHGSSGSEFGPFACQLDRQHELCRARQPDPRQSNRRLTRRTNGFSKDLTWFEKQLWLSLAYYHLVLPHRACENVTNAGADPWSWLTAYMATRDPGDGSRSDRSCLDDG